MSYRAAGASSAARTRLTIAGGVRKLRDQRLHLLPGHRIDVELSRAASAIKA